MEDNDDINISYIVICFIAAIFSCPKNLLEIPFQHHYICNSITRP